MKKLSSVLIALGLISIVSAIIIFVATFYPVIMVELNYQLKQTQGGLEVKRVIIPKDSDFGIVIPKISANSKVIPNVDPYNNIEYQVALTKGVAHAMGTSLPGYAGNVFLFSHSSVNFYEANRYNSIFYLLDKLEKGDEIVKVGCGPPVELARRSLPCCIGNVTNEERRLSLAARRMATSIPTLPGQALEIRHKERLRTARIQSE